MVTLCMLLPACATGFTNFTGMSCVAPFLPVYSRQLGISTSVIGYMTSVLPLSVILAKPLFGVLADRYNRHRLIFISAIAFTGVYFLILFIPSVSYSVDLSVSNVSCVNDTQMLVEMCGSETQSCVSKDVKNFRTFCSISCIRASTPNESIFALSDHLFILNTDINCFNHSMAITAIPNNRTQICNYTDMLHCTTYCACDNNEERAVSPTSYRFVLLFILMFFGYVSAGVAISIGDTLAMDCVTASKGQFGPQRVFGTVSWGMCAFISGQLQKIASVGLPQVNYTPGFYLFLVMLAVCCFSAYNIHVFSYPKQKQMFSHILKVYTDPQLIIFSLAVFAMGFMTSAVWIFLAVYLFDLGAPPELLGYTMGVQCFGGELPIFLLSGFIIRKIGHVHSMSVCLAAYAIRFIGYSFVTNPWWTLPVELTNGFTFGLFYATLVPFASSVAPKGMAATLQGSLQTMFDGLGVGVGNLVIGKLYDHFGGRMLYRILGFTSLICCVLYMVAMAIVGKFGRSQSEDCTVNLSEKSPAAPLQLDTNAKSNGTDIDSQL